MTLLVLGLSRDGWLVLAIFAGFVAATIVGILLAVAYAARRYRSEQELKDIRRAFVDDGALKLKASLDSWLEITRRNYGVAQHLLRYVKDVPYRSRLRPRARDLPTLLPTDDLSLTFDAVVPTTRLLGSEIGALTAHAFADLYAVNLDFQTRISQPVRSYYLQSNGLGDDDRLHWHGELLALGDRGYSRAEQYGALSELLGQAALRFQELQVSSYTDIVRADRDATILRLREEVVQILRQVQPEADANTHTEASG